MKALNRKLLRDLLRMRGQAIAIALVIACGVATFVMSMTTYRSLSEMQVAYYERTRFAHVFAPLKRAPNALGARIAEIPGVGQVQTRVVVDVTLDVPGMVESAVGRLISVAEEDEQGLNQLHLRQGRFLERGRFGEVLVNEAFALAHGLSPGDSVRAVLNGRLKEMRIAGVVLSPEYIYQIRPGDLFPDDRRFGVFWMSDRELAPASELEGAFNSVALSMVRGASLPEILEQLDTLIAPYGGQGSHGREDQTSHHFVSNELVQLRAMALVPPVIFLAVAAFLLNIALNRIISTQREQIAALKAFGYTPVEIGRHYLRFSMVLVFAGVLGGVAGGAWLGRGLTAMYSDFFRFPDLQYFVDPSILLLASGIGALAGLLGVVNAVWQAMRLPPAEAMRPEPPAKYRPTMIERLGLQRFVSQSARIVLREVERKPMRATLSVLGISLAVAVVILGAFSQDLANYLMEFQFQTSQRQDFTVGLIEPTSARVVNELRQLPGVTRAEPFRSVPVRLRSGPVSRRVAIMGLAPERDLFRLLNLDETPVVLPPDGLVLSEGLGEVLRVRPGDTITVEVMEGARPVIQATVAALLDDFSGTSAYMDLSALNRLMREGRAVSGAFLSVDSLAVPEFYREIKKRPRIGSVASLSAMREIFDRIMSENLLRMRFFNVLFGSIIAFGVVYNTARIVLAERSRELATLRVIGFTRAEISNILLGELAVLTLAALPIGVLAGYGLAALAVQALQTETQRFPLVVSTGTFAFAVTVTLSAALFSSLVVRRKLDRLDLVSVLKSRE